MHCDDLVTSLVTAVARARLRVLPRLGRHTGLRYEGAAFAALGAALAALVSHWLLWRCIGCIGAALPASALHWLHWCRIGYSGAALAALALHCLQVRCIGCTGVALAALVSHWLHWRCIGCICAALPALALHLLHWRCIRCNCATCACRRRRDDRAWQSGQSLITASTRWPANLSVGVPAGPSGGQHCQKPAQLILIATHSAKLSTV
jgi:hypothetical protein